MSQLLKTEKIQSLLSIGIIFCTGLFPAIYLPALQLAALFALIGAALNAKTVFREGVQLRWHHLAIAQFLILSLLNTLYFPSLDGNKLHYKPLAIEALSLSFLLLGALILFMHKRRGMEQIWQKWLPLGLITSFAIMSLYYFSGSQGLRPKGFTPNALYPPMWFLTLTLISFCGFASMSARAKQLRYLLLGMAALMAMYSGGRLSLIAWLIATLFLASQYLPKDDPKARKRALGLAIGGFALLLALVFIVDHANDGTMLFRLYFTAQTLLSGQAADNFFRLEIWSAAWSIIAERPILGHGQVNERFLLQQILQKDWWFRSHQTYLSYWIGGGLLGLISGIALQLAALDLFSRRSGAFLRPAAFGLVIILGLHGLTESVFQSFVAVQMFILLIFLRLPSQKGEARN